ncbi:MAG: hypothetical protein ACJ73N_03220 [Bryobacteraceae bacterium]
MRKLLLLSLWMPLAAFGSAIYSFSEPVANRGTVGFTYTAPEYLTESRNYIPVWLFTSCDTSGMQGWVCEGAWLSQTNFLGNPGVQVSLNLRYAAGIPGDAFNTDEINASFSPAQLDQDGVYHAFLNPGATFTVHDPPTPEAFPGSGDAVAPEPGTGRMLAGAGLVLIVLGGYRSYKARRIVGGNAKVRSRPGT